MATGGGSNLGTATLELGGDLRTLKRDLDKAENMANKRLDDFSRRARATGLAVAGVGAALVAPLALSIKRFASFEQSMANVAAVSSATTDEFRDLDMVARRMGATTVFTAGQSADALGFMAMAGINAAQSIQALPAVLNTAAAGQIDLADAADIVTNIMAGYGIAAADVGQATDVLVTGFTSANTNLLQLGEAFTYAGPVAKAAGIEFEETAAALALMGNAGFQGTLAGTSFRGAIVRLLKPSGEASDVLDRLGVTILDSSGAMLPFTNILEQLETSGLSASDAMTIFGQRAGPAMLALIEQGSDALRTLSIEMENSGGTAQRIADRQLDTFQGSMTLLSSAVDGVAITIGSSLAPALREVVDFISPLVQGFTAWAENNKGLATAIFVAIGALGVLLLVGGLSLVMAGVLTASWAATGLTFALVALKATAMWAAITGPVGLAVLAALAIAAGLAYLYYRFEAVRVVVNAVWEAFSQFAAASWRALQPLIDALRVAWTLVQLIAGALRAPPEKVFAPADAGFESNVGADQVGGGATPGTGSDIAQSVQQMGDQVEDAVVKTSAGLITGRTRWRNVYMEKAQTSFLDDLGGIFDETNESLRLAAVAMDTSSESTKSLVDTIKSEGLVVGLKTLVWDDWLSDLSWSDWVGFLTWSTFINPMNWLGFISPITWTAFVSKFTWDKWIGPLSWADRIKTLAWGAFIAVLGWPVFVTKLLWDRYLKELVWEPYVVGLVWQDWINGFLWQDFVNGLVWQDFVNGLVWQDWINGFLWQDFIHGLVWQEWIKNLDWRIFLLPLSWPAFVVPLAWDRWLSRVSWPDWISPLSWWTWISTLSWWTWISNLSWWTWISSLSWWTWISTLSWWTWISNLSWWTWISTLSWWTWISNLSWWTWISTLSWWTWISNLSWWTWISTLSWWTWISNLSWWTWISTLSWWTWISNLSWWTWISTLSWWTWISNLSWWTWISTLSWWTWISNLSWWTWISTLSWWTWISNLGWGRWISNLSWSGFVASLGWRSFVPRLNWSSFISHRVLTSTRTIIDRVREVVPGFASGGIAMEPTLGMFGEEKPEALIPLDRLPAMLGRMGGQGGGGMTVVVEGNILDGDDFWDKVSYATRQVKRGGGRDLL